MTREDKLIKKYKKMKKWNEKQSTNPIVEWVVIWMCEMILEDLKLPQEPTEQQWADVEKKLLKWNKFITTMIDMNIWDKVIYEHPSYRIYASKDKQENKDIQWYNTDVIIIDDVA